jgi:hypothetical protein
VKYLAIFLYDSFFIGGAVYLHGWKGWSGWWVVFGFIISWSSGGFNPRKEEGGEE